MCIKTIKTFLYVLFGLANLGQGVLEEVTSDRFSLKQVVILSRHGLRTPLSKYLVEMTPRRWPEWKEKAGQLTTKGAILEGHMGHFFSLWFNESGLLTKQCPKEKDFFTYANTKKRTIKSAQAFVDGAFPGCNVTVHHSKMNIDPIFNPVIHNSSSTFTQFATEDMKRVLNSLHLNNSYMYVQDILDYSGSEICMNEGQCDLVKDKNKVSLEVGDKPNVFGPIKTGNSVIDAFIMQYYEGFDFNDVAWGYIHTMRDWKTLSKLRNGYHNVIFNTPLVARDISKPLIEYMRNFFLDSSSPKITLLMAHDANIFTVMKTLRFKPYMLLNQYEVAPIGGKLVFQKYHDNVKDKDLLKVDYVYQSFKQLRHNTKLDLMNPPQFKCMELEDCVADENSLCSWEQFERILKTI